MYCVEFVQKAFYFILTENYGKAHIFFSSPKVKSISKLASEEVTMIEAIAEYEVSAQEHDS